MPLLKIPWGQENLDLFKDDENTQSKKMANLIIDEGLRNNLSEINGVECTVYYEGDKGLQAPQI